MKLRSRVLTALLVIAAMLTGLAATALADGDGRGRDKVFARGFERGFQAGVRFHDMDDAPWAGKFVTAGQVTGVIRGFEDGTFRPNQPVSRAEAVVMTIRALGLEDKARQVGEQVYLQLPYQDAVNIPAWAVGHVRLALDMGLVQETGGMFQPHKPASRVWVVPVLVKSLGLKSQAESRMNEQLTFTDAAGFPAGASGYVAVGVDVGLVAGFPDNTFRPFQPVTRAQMAKMLQVVQDQLHLNNQNRQATGYMVQGVVAAVYGDTITLKSAGSLPAVYNVVYDARIFLDDKPATLADLKPGTLAKLFLDSRRAVVFIDARTARLLPPVQRRNPFLREFRGTVSAVDPGALTISVYGRDGAAQTFDVAEWAEVKIEDMGYATLADVKPGDRVDLKIRQNVASGEPLVVKIEVRSPEDVDEGGRGYPGGKRDGWRGREGWAGQVEGVVTAVYGGRITVETRSGESFDIPVDDRTMISSKWGFAPGSGGLQPGDRVKVIVRQGVALRIKVEGGYEFKEDKKFKERGKRWSNFGGDGDDDD